MVEMLRRTGRYDIIPRNEGEIDEVEEEVMEE